MHILILGGTRFVGRHLVSSATTRGHAVTLFNRGQSHAGPIPGVEQLIGDRDGGLDALKGRRWDAVIDTCGYVPRIVRASAELLADAVDHYTFISSISVYPDPVQPGTNEDGPLATMADESVEEITMGTYGPLKVLCEQAAEAAMPGRVLNVRPGLIVGPYDPTDRFTYWPARIAKGGEVLAPEPRSLPVQFIDGRDLAGWTIRMVEQNITGAYNATGPAEMLTFEALLDAAMTVLPGDAALTWVSAEFLAEHNVTLWSDLPVVAPADDSGILQLDISKALDAGLTFRPLQDSIRDTFAWSQTRPTDYKPRAGLAAAREAELLSLWRSRNG